MSRPPTTPCPKCGNLSANHDICDMCGAIFEKVRARNAAEDALFERGEQMEYGHSAPASAPQSVPLWMKVGLVAVLVVVGAFAAYTRFKPVQPPAGFIEGRPMVLEFWASWCGPCKVYGPVLEDVAGGYEGRITLQRVNVDENQQVAKEYGVNAIPLTLVFDGKGRVARKLVGAVPAEELKAAIESAL